MGRLRDLISGYRASRALGDVDPQTLQSLASITPAAGGAEGFDPAAHMERLAAAGLVSRPTLDASDSRLEAVEGMPFEVYVKLVAASITTPTDEQGLEARGVELGMAPGATQRAFELWGERVVGDPELGVHYTAVLQAELAATG